jgi:hypothetical protein
MALLSNELEVIWQYIRAVLKYWWLIVVGLGLTLLDFIERIFSTWWTFPLSVRVTAAIGGVMVAQYLAYRDFRRASDERISQREISLHVESEGLRHGVAELEGEIGHLQAENAKLKVKPYDEAQRQTIDGKLKTYSDTERDLLRFLMQRGETEGSVIYKASQDGHDICSRVLERLGVDGMVQMREDMSQANVWRPRYYRVNPIFDCVLRDALYPRTGTQAAPRFII